MPVTDTSKKVRNVIKRRQEEGKWICSVPFGYYITNSKAMTFEVDPVSAETVRPIFQKYIEGWGYGKIANWLTDNHYPTPRRVEKERKEARGEKTKIKAKDTWSLVSVQEILDNDFYIGTLRQRKNTKKKINGSDVKLDEDDQIVFENNHEPIIDYKTYSIVRELRSQRTKSHYRGFKKYDNVYSGFLVCGDCGSPMYSMSSGDLQPAYTCGSYQRRGRAGCTSHHIRADILDKVLKQYIRRLRDESFEVIDYLQESIKDDENVRDKSIDVVAALQKRLTSLQAELKATKAQKIRDIMHNPEDSDIIEETYAEMEKELTDQISDVKSQLAISTNKMNTVTSATKVTRSVIEVFDNMLNKDKFTKEDIVLIIDHITVYEDRLDVEFKSDIKRLLRCGMALTAKKPELQNIIQESDKHRKKTLSVTDSIEGEAELFGVINSGDPLEIFADKEGDVMGLIALPETPDKKLTASEEKLLATTAMFPGKQMES